MNVRQRNRAPLVASYRLQLTPRFGFDRAAGLLDHLTTLGVSHVYLSPIAEAVPGSSHGYDVVDHRVVRSEFGGLDGLTSFLDAAGEHDLGVVIDHVPNHTSVALAELNPRWWELLRDGPASAAAAWFDVDWALTGGKVIVPKLGAPPEDLVAAGELVTGVGDLGAELRYGPLRFPLAAGTEHLPVAEALERQQYRLTWWRAPERNVRRFFTIDDLVGLRVEDPDVADVVDTIPTMLSDHPAFAGVRVDHIDGLADPGAYLHRLRERIGDRWLLVEKILAPGETLPPSWPVDGTTGYEHIRVTDHAFIDPTADEHLTRLWNGLTADPRTFEQIEDQARREVLAGGLRPDLDRLVRTVVASRHVTRRSDRLLSDSGAPPLTKSDNKRIWRAGAGTGGLDEAVRELTIALHRYRTYLGDDPASDTVLERAHAVANATRPDLADQLADVVEMITADVSSVRTRWQQLTSPVMAKGAEDRAFYRYLRLASLCEVGGTPGDLALTDEAFHDHQRQVLALTPATMNAGTTHDTKRSEDVRARSLALAELGDTWSTTVRTWFDGHAGFLDRSGLDAATVLLALQTVVTAWPIDVERLTAYLVKSAREADLHTTWTEPDDAYESALTELARIVITEAGSSGTGTLADVADRIHRPGWNNSLAALVIRLTAPGVPDLYQGTEAFTYRLVDPDNRVPPDWDGRRSLVTRARSVGGVGAGHGDAAPPDTGSDRDDAGEDLRATAKAFVIERTLSLRRRRGDAFGAGSTYVPLTFTGAQADRLLGFIRGDSTGPVVATIVVRRSIDAPSWSATTPATTVELPGGTWRNVLDDDAHVIAGGTAVPVEWWLRDAPVAVLERTAT